MLFTSYNFILFLLALFIIYYIIPQKYQWLLLLVASFFFYRCSGWDNVAYITVTITATYFTAVKIGQLHRQQELYLKENKGSLSKEEKKAYKDKVKSKQKKYLLLCLFFDLGVLAVVKYTNFAISNINSVSKIFNAGELSFLDIALPMGISFYTFQSVGYLVDVYRGKYAPEKNIGKFALFVSFFPQLIQGPISRFDDLGYQLYSGHSFDFRNVSFGIQRILWGFFKKLVIADRILPAVKTITQNPDTYQGIYVLIGMVFYAIQLYADFTGGIDITIGIAEVLGIKLKENFERPFFSKSTAEYWRRWHISMGTWFRDYVFYPVSVSNAMLKISKFSREKFGENTGKRVPVYLSTIIVWFATGIWHGASWNFIVWGLLNCLVIIVSQELEPFYAWFHNRFNVRDKFMFKLFQVGRTFLLMSAIRILDCYRNVRVTFRMYGSMVTKWNIGELFNGALLKLGIDKADYFVLLFGIIIMIVISLAQRNGSIREKLSARPDVIRYAAYVGLFISIIVFGAYGVGYDRNQFIYNQF